MNRRFWMDTIFASGYTWASLLENRAIMPLAVRKLLKKFAVADPG